MADLTSVGVLLKEVYLQTIENTFNDETIVLSHIEKTSDGIRQDFGAGIGSTGKYALLPLHTSRSQGIGSRLERTTLPTPGQQGYSVSKVYLRSQYVVCDITSQALNLAEGDPQSFINAFDAEQEGQRSDAVHDYCRQIYGSPTGTLGVVSSYSGGVVTLDAASFPYGNEYFERNMRVDVLTSAGVLKTIGAATVTDVSTSTNAVTLSGTFTSDPSSTDIIVRQGDYGGELSGFNSMVQTSGTYQDLAPATTPEWVAQSVAAGGAYSEKHIFRLLDRIRRTSSKVPSVLFTGTSIWRSAYDALDSDRRWVNTVEFAHGVSGIPLNYKGKVLPIVDDVAYPENPYPTLSSTTGDILALCEETIKLFRHGSGWTMCEESGAMFIPAADRSDAYEFRLRQHSQLATSLRGSHGRVTGITITA